MKFSPLSLAMIAGTALTGFSAAAAGLPKPYVSKALDAVLIPVTADVKKAFDLAKGEKGILVLAVQPGGVAEKAGIAAGDVIDLVHGKSVMEPVSLDEIVYYFIKQNSTDFGFNGWHAGAEAKYDTVITEETWSETIDVTTVSSWSSVTVEGFDYASYSEEYSSEISESYSSEEQTIETEDSSEVFTNDESADGEGTDPNLDTDGDGTPDVTDTDDDNDGIPDAQDPDENGDGEADSSE